jgi:hypothetical protein
MPFRSRQAAPKQVPPNKPLRTNSSGQTPPTQAPPKQAPPKQAIPKKAPLPTKVNNNNPPKATDKKFVKTTTSAETLTFTLGTYTTTSTPASESTFTSVWTTPVPVTTGCKKRSRADACLVDRGAASHDHCCWQTHQNPGGEDQDQG